MKELTMPNGYKINLYTPKELKAYLDRFIIGQDEAKKVLSVAIYNHYKRIALSATEVDSKVEKSNILLAGPTGCGKSAMIKHLAKYIGVPCYIADATTLTQAGYVGDDVESIITGLLRNCGWSLSNAEYGIIAIDEIDKIAKRSSSVNISRDVVGEGVQQALLKMVEGDLIGVPPQEGRKHPEQQLLYVNTKNILFIGMGAFSGIDEMIRGRLNVKKIGFEGFGESNEIDDDRIFDYLSHEDLRKFGMIPEFIGRFPIIANVNSLDVDDLVKILTEPENSVVKQFQYLLSLDNINLIFKKDALKFMAEVASKMGNGARGLRALIESTLNEFVYEFSSKEYKNMKKIEIGKEDVEKKISSRYQSYLKEI